MPDLNRGALKRTGQCRTSTGELQSGLGNAGPQPGTVSGLGSGEFQLPEDMSEEDVTRYVRKECQKLCQKKCQKICQKRMSEDRSEEMSDGTQKKYQKIRQGIC